MAHPVYSTQFLSHQGLSGSGTTITVPDGHVYVVKQLTFYANPFLGIVRGYFRDVDSGAALFSAGVTPQNPGWFGFYGQLVFEPGRSFRWEATAFGTDGIDVSAHGYDLTGP